MIRRPALLSILVMSESVLSALRGKEGQSVPIASLGISDTPLLGAAVFLLVTEGLLEMPSAVMGTPQPIVRLTKEGERLLSEDVSKGFDPCAFEKALYTASPFVEAAPAPPAPSAVPMFADWERGPASPAAVAVHRVFSAGDIDKAEHSGAILRVALSGAEVQTLTGELEEATFIVEVSAEKRVTPQAGERGTPSPSEHAS